MTAPQTYLDGLQAQADEEHAKGAPLRAAWVAHILSGLTDADLLVLDSLLRLQEAGLLRGSCGTSVLDRRARVLLEAAHDAGSPGGK